MCDPTLNRRGRAQSGGGNQPLTFRSSSKRVASTGDVGENGRRRASGHSLGLLTLPPEPVLLVLHEEGARA